MEVVARIKDGNLLLKEEINERMPAIRNGLVAHFPLDSKAGSFDKVGGLQFREHTTGNTNLIEAMELDWRDPSSWYSSSGLSWSEEHQAMKVVGYHNTWLKTPIIVDPAKHYQISIEVMQEVAPSSGLYLGGYSLNANKECVTPSYDYSYAFNAEPGQGIWTTFRVTRYGTGNITSNTSYSFDKIVGWMGTRSGIDDLMTKYYYFGGLFNYSSGGVLYVKNPRITIIDEDNSNASFTDMGVAIEEATTNLFLNPFLEESSTGWNRYDNPGKVTNFQRERVYDCPFADYAMRADFNQVNSGQGCGFYLSSGSHTAGTYYTKSMWVKSSMDGVIASATYSNIGYSGSSVILKAGIWTRIQAYHYNETTTQADALYFGFYHPTAEKFTVWGTAGQWEARAFATSPVKGSRGVGRLTLENILEPKGTISFDFVKDVIPSSGYMMPMRVAKNIFQFNIRDAGTYLFPTSNYPSLKVGQKYTATIAWDLQANFLKTYLNGSFIAEYSCPNYVSEFGTTYQSLHIGSGGSGSYVFNGIISNLSIYNRALNSNEVKKLASESSKVTKTGSFVLPYVIERPNSLPSDAYYFPLTFNAQDQYKDLGPSSEANLVYQDEGVWVGTATTNLIPNPSDINNTSWTKEAFSGVITTNATRAPNGTYTADQINMTAGYVYRVISLAANTTYVFSAWIKSATDQNISNGGLAFWTYSGGSRRVAYIPTTITPEWQRVSLVYTTEEDQTSFSMCIAGAAITLPYNVHIWGVQLEKKDFLTPFIEISRNTSSLEFNFHQSIGLDWSKDWSVVYWKKPIGTNTNNLTGYNIESLGSNPNSVGGGYLWWGKELGSNTITNSSPLPMDPLKYFGHWRMVSLIKSSSTLTIKEWSLAEGVYTRTVSAAITEPSYYVSQHGYDFKMSGYNNGNVTNSYFRDLIVAKRAFANNELEELFRVHMRSHKDQVQIQGSIYEERL